MSYIMPMPVPDVVIIDGIDESREIINMQTCHLRSVHEYLANKIVFNVSRKTPSLTAGSRSSTGSEFQTVGPPTEKARRPSVLRRYLGTIKRCRLADRMDVDWQRRRLECSS